MSRSGKVIVAMSGGVDSSVAACLLQQSGYECVGVFMRVGSSAVEQEAAACAAAPQATATSLPLAAQPRRLRHGCCSTDDALDARAIASRLGIPFYALNFQRDFAAIMDYFIAEYASGRTPNPCVMCNIDLKFGKLLRYADAMDAAFVATGHYARIVQIDGQARLARGVNTAKDQSYVLFGMQRDALPRCLFPLGEMADKAQVRAIAQELGLRVHDKPDSQEICFVPGNDYRRLLDERAPGLRRPGEIRDASGKPVGTHDGVAGYTIGQRRGLGAMGRPMYVTRLDVASNTVFVGEREALQQSGLVAQRVNWLSEPPPVGEPLPAHIKIRHLHTPASGWITRQADGSVRAGFDAPQPAVTPGQAAVFYAGDLVLGGGWIADPGGAG